MRPVPLLGAELDRIDLGPASGRFARIPTGASTRGTGAFGVLYLPQVSPALDVYAKAGVARLTSTLNATAFLPGSGICLAGSPTCKPLPFSPDRTDTGFAGGAGAQFKLGSWALRLECEQFLAVGGHPGFVSIGFTWSFM